MIQNRIFTFDDFSVKRIFFEPNELGLFLKEENHEEKVLNFHSFTSD
jgi:hypothetical protein